MAAVNLHLDFETYSEIELKKVGLDNYLAYPSTEVLMLAWATNDALPAMWFPGDGPILTMCVFLSNRQPLLNGPSTPNSNGVSPSGYLA